MQQQIPSSISAPASALPAVTDPVVKVRPVNQDTDWVDWNITQDLTTRFGEINADVDGLTEGSPLLDRLLAQMWDEISFVVRKDGKFGILFEVEYCSKESEERDKNRDPQWYAGLNHQADVIENLKRGMRPLQEKFPSVQFAIPDENHVFDGRPAAWAFIPDGALNEHEREEIGKALLDL